jgi:hypothetical protein
MPDPHNNPDKPAAENSSQNPSFIQKLNAFVEHPRTPGGEPSTWVPVREELKDARKRLGNMLKGFEIRKK